MDLCWKVMSLVFSMLSRLVITFLPRSKHPLISWVWMKPANHCTICSGFGAPKNKVWHCFYCFPIYFPLMLGGIGAGGEGDDRGWDGWMASLTQWTWVWVNSGNWWWTGRPGVLRFMGSQSLTQLSDWTKLTELTKPNIHIKSFL